MLKLKENLFLLVKLFILRGGLFMEKIVIWPAYLTAGKTKGEGRIVSRRNAVKSPKIEEIEKGEQNRKERGDCEEDCNGYKRDAREIQGKVKISNKEALFIYL
jgi:signal recognition particle subunit SRP19